MKLSHIADDRVILLLGGPRSGTTWLAKILDSHPDVLYRHEPDTVERNQDVQTTFSPEAAEAQRKATSDYLHRLIGISTLKTAGSLPVFPKSFHNPVQHVGREAIIYGLRILEKLSGASTAAKRFPVPDMVDAERNPDLRVVIKSVSSRRCVGLYADSLPGARIIFIVRDPWGQIASMIRGAALGKFAEPAVREVLGTEQAARYGLTETRLRAMEPIERFAWHWVVLNQKAIEELEGRPNAKVLKYQDLCADPVGISQKLFEFAGLSWNPQTAAFLAKSTHAHGPDRYYQIYKDPATSLHKWRKLLSEEDQRRILEVVQQTPMWAYCWEHEPELLPPPPRIRAVAEAYVEIP